MLDRKCSPLTYEEYFASKLSVQEGTHEYKFVCEGVWFTDFSKQISSETGHINNVFIVSNYNEEERCMGILFTDTHISEFKWTNIEIDDLPFYRIEGHSTTQVANSLYIFGGCRVGGGYRNQMLEIELNGYK
jgi:hypothetical protein